MTRALAFALVLAGCFQHHSYPPPDVPRSCTEPQRRESVECTSYDFEVRFSTEADLSRPAEAALFHNPSRTECGCFQNLAAAVDAAAQRDVRSEVLEGCRCTRER